MSVGTRVAGTLGSASSRLRGRDEFGVLVTLAALFAVIGIFRPRFLDPDSLTNVATQASFFGIMALGMVFVMTMRDIDLSVGSIYGLTLTATGLLMQSGVDPWVAGALGIAVGTGAGLLNGVLINTLRITAIIVTLGTMSIYRGLTLVIADGRTVAGLPRTTPFFTILGGDFLGVPVIVWAFAVATIVLSVLYRSTRFGFCVRAIGSNPAAATLSGISIPRYRLAVLALSGTLAGVAGVLTLAFFEVAHPSVGIGTEMFVIAATIIGGTALTGGSGSVIGAAIGALIVSIIRSGLIQFGVTANWSAVATGAVIIGAVALDTLIRRRRQQDRHSAGAPSK